MRLSSVVPVVGLCAVFFLPSANAGDARQLVNVGAVHCMDVNNGNDREPVRLNPCNSSFNNQRWELHKVGKYAQLKNKGTGQCLDLRDLSKENGAAIQQYPCRAAGDKLIGAQLWEHVKVGKLIQIKSAHSGKCLDNPLGNSNAGSALQQYTCRGEDDPWFYKSQAFIVKDGYNQPK